MNRWCRHIWNEPSSKEGRKELTQVKENNHEVEGINSSLEGQHLDPLNAFESKDMKPLRQHEQICLDQPKPIECEV